MQVLGGFLIAYGVFCLAGLLLQFPFLYNNPKSKIIIKMMGKLGYNILILVFGLAGLIAGILILA